MFRHRPDGWLPRFLAAWALLPWAAVGCGPDDGLGRRAISGTVTIDGRPLDGGAILLEPVADGTGTQAGGVIRQGAFSIPRDQGPVPGRYRVRIYASSGTQAPPAKGRSDRTARPMVERLPPAYNTRSQLRVDVTARGTNRYRFELSATGPGDRP